MKKIRILVVEDQNVVREGMIAILSFQTDMEVVGEAADGIQAVEMARKTRPDVILLDMVMPRQDGLTTIPKLRSITPERAHPGALQLRRKRPRLPGHQGRRAGIHAEGHDPGAASAVHPRRGIRPSIDPSIHRHESDPRVRPSVRGRRSPIRPSPAASWKPCA